MASIPNNAAWNEFLDNLEILPELWDVKSDDYKNKYKKKRALESLFFLYKNTIDGEANLEKLKQRISNIKTSYRRELKKVNDSMKSGAGTQEICEPGLWYFEKLSFLKDQEVQLEGLCSSSVYEDPFAPATPVLKKRRTIQKALDEKNELLRSAVESLNTAGEPDDEATSYAKGWAISYRKLNSNQKLMAKKAIDDILIMGQLEQLQLDTVSIQTAPSTPIYLHDQSFTYTDHPMTAGQLLTDAEYS